MRKKCGPCGFIAFMSDESCKRCGSHQFVIVADPDKLQGRETTPSHKLLSFWSYLKYFSIAVLIEIVALAVFIPALGEQMMRHSGNVPQTQTEMSSEVFAFILHLPTILIMWPLTTMTGSFIVLLTPITQIVFFTCLFACIGRARRMRLK